MSAWPTQEEQRESWLRDVAGQTCPSCGSPIGYCYFICPLSPEYYSAEQEREDSLYNDSLSYDEWFRQSVHQYESVHGEGSYCS